MVLRLDERRTLAQMSPFDFVVAVALGAIVARTATTPEPTYVQGLVAILVLLLTHRLLGVLRARSTRVWRALEKPPVVLVSRGDIHRTALRDAHLVESDLLSMLRGHGVVRLQDVDLAVLESNGTVSVLRAGGEPVEKTLLTGIECPDRGTGRSLTPGRRRRVPRGGSVTRGRAGTPTCSARPVG